MLYPFFVVYAIFVGYCFYSAWYRTEVFQGQVDKVNDYLTGPNIWTIGITILLLGHTLGGTLYFWFQH